MISGRLANLFVDVSVRGGILGDLTKVRDQIAKADVAMVAGGAAYKAGMQAKMGLLAQYSDRLRKLHAIEASVWAGPQYAGMRKAQFGQQAAANRSRGARADADRASYRTPAYEAAAASQQMANLQEQRANLTKLLVDMKAQGALIGSVEQSDVMALRRKVELQQRLNVGQTSLLDLEERIDALRRNPAYRGVAATDVRVAQSRGLLATSEQLMQIEERLAALRSDPKFQARERDLLQKRLEVAATTSEAAKEQAGLLGKQLATSEGKMAAGRKALADLETQARNAQNAAQQSGINEDVLKTPAGKKAMGDKLTAETTGKAADTRAETEMLKAKLALYRSPQYKALLKDELERNKTQKKVDDAAHYQRLIAEHGKVVGSLKLIEEKMRGVGIASAAMFAAGSAGIMATLAATSPEVWGTLTGSIQLLTGTIGQMFIPVLAQVSYWLQQAAEWIRNLDPATRQQIATWAVWGVGLAGVVMVGVRMISMLATLGTAFYAMGTAATVAFRAIAMFAVANPAIAAILLIVAALGALYFGLNQINAAANAQFQQSQATIATLGSGGRVTTTMWNALPAAMRSRILNAPAGAARQNVVNEIMQENQAAVTAAQTNAQGAPQAQAQAEAQIANPGGFWGRLWRTVQGMSGQGPLAQFGSATQAIQGATNAQAIQATLQAIQHQGVPGQQQNRPNPDLLTSSNHQAGFIAIEQAWRQMQQSAASGGSLEARMLQMQTESYTQLTEINANTNQTAQNTGGAPIVVNPPNANPGGAGP